jgi:cathepsin A (carboxypeptidase C)
MRSLLTLLIIATIFTAAFSFVNEEFPEVQKHDDPIFLNETFYSGFVPIGVKGSLFYWLFESRQEASKDPLVVWLTGGPGCSSELGLFVENGPFKINDDRKTLSINAHSWNNVANVLYVDQPIGTGFSPSLIYDVNEQQIASDFYIFLQGFVKAFPQFAGRDLYITGESYAGHYIPAMSAEIVRKGGLKLNFKGIAIGNGLVSMYHQYPDYATFAVENNIITQKEFPAYQAAFKVCQTLLKTNQTQYAMLECQLTFMKMIGGRTPKFNVYDIRQKCEHPPLCYDLSNVDDFLKQDAVRKALKVKKSWTACSTIVHAFLTYDFPADLTTDLALVADSGIKVMLYHGDKDFICNWKGGETVSGDLKWRGQSGFAQAKFTANEKYGEYRKFENFIFYRVFDAGHMVPMDQPEAAIKLLSKFINGW